MRVRPGSVLLLAAVFCGSCSQQGPIETRLVSRVFQEADVTCDDQAVCRFEFPGETFRVADGRTATTESDDVEWVLERLARGEVECGDEAIQTDGGWRLLDAEPDQRRDALVFDDGSAVDLFLESWVAIVDTCYESVGRWEGVAGRFEGRSGTYRWTGDLVQVEIVLTDS